MNPSARWRPVALGLAMLCVRAALGAEPAGLSATECEVWERERTFAESVDRHDRKSFAEHLHENAVFGAASPNPQRGRDAVLKAWDGIIAGKDVQLVWRPQFVSQGTDTNVAMSRGPFAITAKNDKGETKHAIGHFVSVWTRKDQASPWYVVFDGGGPPPTPATEEEAKKHLAAAPAACPRAASPK
jgi:ketosteroid isomerase-like protein